MVFSTVMLQISTVEKTLSNIKLWCNAGHLISSTKITLFVSETLQSIKCFLTARFFSWGTSMQGIASDAVRLSSLGVCWGGQGGGGGGGGAARRGSSNVKYLELCRGQEILTRSGRKKLTWLRKCSWWSSILLDWVQWFWFWKWVDPSDQLGSQGKYEFVSGLFIPFIYVSVFCAIITLFWWL